MWRSMPSRRRSKSPEYIQLQPYRALVGVPVNRSRMSSMIQAFIWAFVKAALFCLIPVCLLLVGYSYLTGGFTNFRDAISQQGGFAALVVGIVGLIAGTVAAARR